MHHSIWNPSETDFDFMNAFPVAGLAPSRNEESPIEQTEEDMPPSQGG